MVCSILAIVQPRVAICWRIFVPMLMATRSGTIRAPPSRSTPTKAGHPRVIMPALVHHGKVCPYTMTACEIVPTLVRLGGLLYVGLTFQVSK